MFRSTRELRKLPVRDLTPGECARLMVHSHPGGVSNARRRAYLLKSDTITFKPEDRAEVERWIENEQMDVKGQVSA